MRKNQVCRNDFEKEVHVDKATIDSTKNKSPFEIVDLMSRTQMNHLLKELGTETGQRVKLERLGELISGICHEIVNPVTIINGNLHVIDTLLKEEDFKNPLLVSNIRSISAASLRIDKIIKNTLLVARKNDLSSQQIQVVELINNVLDLIKPQLSEHLIHVEFHPEDEVHLSIQTCEFTQILLNLLSNAKDAIKEHRSRGSGKIKIGLKVCDDKSAEISISDNGKGIPEAIHHSIFDSFFTTKNAQEGTGLGLSITRELVEKNDGSINFESHESSGTTFKIKLPMA